MRNLWHRRPYLAVFNSQWVDYAFKNTRRVSKTLRENLRGRPYDLGLDEIERRGREAWARNATELCLQGDIHPDYTGETYVDICRRPKAALSGMHLHAFTPL